MAPGAARTPQSSTLTCCGAALVHGRGRLLVVRAARGDDGLWTLNEDKHLMNKLLAPWQRPLESPHLLLRGPARAATLDTHGLNQQRTATRARSFSRGGTGSSGEGAAEDSDDTMVTSSWSRKESRARTSSRMAARPEVSDRR
ncbi:hypothetical protein PAHAL_6G284400 [Panicum hallii]|uniref:Uncharacterized protein n=1 Tax=Panicum hallii TaxID=206008 RepID=A0A270R4M0_9POAL|nr:hypothetical protein PAHAL_6G284400 [Panicum hallii]